MADRMAAATDGDGGWKQAVEDDFEDYLRFYFPKVHQAIDFSVPVDHLEQELRRLFPQSEVSQRVVDKVVRVRWKDGGEALLLIHIEIQGQRRSNFAERMFTYYYRLVDRFESPVTSLALLVDPDPGFRPSSFVLETPGTRLRFDFSVVKLLDFKTESELLADPSPFALVSLIQLRKLQAGTDAERVFLEKSQLARELFGRGYSAERVCRLFRFLDYIMQLPPELDRKFEEELVQAGETAMTYLSAFERRAMAKGEAKGEVKGEVKGEAKLLLRQIERKFGEVTDEVRERIDAADSSQLLAWAERILTAESVAELFE